MFTASVVYGLAMFVVAVASDFDGFLVGMAISGLGFGVYMAVDLALVADVLPGKDNAKDLGVLNIAGALLFTLAPAVLTIGAGVTVRCTRSPGSAPSSGRSPSCRCAGRAELRSAYRPLRTDSRSSSSPRRTAERRLLTPSLA